MQYFPPSPPAGNSVEHGVIHVGGVFAHGKVNHQMLQSGASSLKKTRQLLTIDGFLFPPHFGVFAHGHFVLVVHQEAVVLGNVARSLQIHPRASFSQVN